CYLKYCKAELGPCADRDFAGNPRLQIFDRVVDQIGEDLLQRQTIADDGGQGCDTDFGLRLYGLMRQRLDDPLDQFAHVDVSWLELAPPFSGEIEDRRDKTVHLGDRGFDEAERFGKILRELPILALKPGLRVSGNGVRRLDTGAGQGSNPFEYVAAQFFEL